MTYNAGQPIQATDFNGFVDQINQIYGDLNTGSTTLNPASFGYGILPNLPHVAVGDTVTAADWTSLFSHIHSCGTHQGTSVTPIPPSVSPGDLVVAYNDYLSGPTLMDVITNLTANRLSIAVSQVTSDNTPPVQVSSITWTTGLQLTFQIDFGSWNNARYFFNTGGKVTFAGSLPGSYTPGSASKYWQDMLADMGTVRFAWHSTIPSSGNGSSLGFYDLTTSYLEVYKKSSISGEPIAYGNNYISVQAKLNAAAGTNGKVDFAINLIDNDSTLPLDTKPAGFTFNIGYLVSAGAVPYPGTRTFVPGSFTQVPNGGGGGPILNLSVSPTSLSASIVGNGTATTAPVTATASGGTSPYSYQWTNSSGTVTFSAPTSATTTFSKALTTGQSASGTALVTVTDSASNTAFAPVPWALNSNASVPPPTIDVYSNIPANASPSASFTVGTYTGTIDSYTLNSGPSGTYSFSGGLINFSGDLPYSQNNATISLTVTNTGGSASDSGTLSVTPIPATITTTDWTFPINQSIATFTPPRKTVATSTAGITSGSLNSGTLPPGTGLTFNQGSNQDVVISGVPTSGGVYSFTVNANSPYSNPTTTVSPTINITITVPVPIYTNNNPTLSFGTVVSSSLATPTSGYSINSFSTGSSLPAGISVFVSGGSLVVASDGTTPVGNYSVSGLISWSGNSQSGSNFDTFPYSVA